MSISVHTHTHTHTQHIHVHTQTQRETWPGVDHIGPSHGLRTGGGTVRYLYAVGGEVGQVFPDDDKDYMGYLAASPAAWRHELALQEWVKVTNLRRFRSMAAACAFDGRCVVAGGFDNDHATTPAVERHNPQLDKWEPMGRLVLARDSFSLVVVDQQMLAIGGWDHKHRLVADVERYDASLDRWNIDSSTPMSVPRGGMAVAQHMGLVYAAGGFDTDACVTKVVEAYDVLEGSWTAMPDLQTARAMCAALSTNGALYVTGGLDPATGEVFPSFFLSFSSTAFLALFLFL